MLFTSIDFAVFLPVVFLLYWFVIRRNIRLQNLLILIASYIFYGWWDWRFLTLILFSTLVDFLVGQRLKNAQNTYRRKLFLWISIFTNLGFLGFFKYYNFFLENFASAFTFFGGQLRADALQIVLPVGISFYTFQTLSYTIDVYRRKIDPSDDFIGFAAYVSFFPQLVAGPIERATHLLPQFYTKRTFNYTKAADGMRQILWGLFKKVVIADNCAHYVDIIFSQSDGYSGSTLILGAVLFAFQIYGDFSGYSDIAIGTARLFGFDLMRNFAYPYFSRDIAEFWRRWHISLSTWFRDYLYIPLGGSRGPKSMQVRNIFIIFVVSGFWHGANWTFIVWGALNALYFLPLLLAGINRRHTDIVAEYRSLPTLCEAWQMVFTFALSTFAWIFFRAENISHALQYIHGIFDYSSFTMPTLWPGELIAFILLFVGIEWKGRRDEFALETLGLKWKPVWRYVLYFGLIITLFEFGGKEQQFIYFQF